VLYLALPVMMAAAVHIVAIRFDMFKRLKVPIDFGWTLRGRRVFGNNKTWRGALIMILVPSAAMALQQRLRLPGLELFDYGGVNAWLCGGLLGLGFVLAELPNSFLKRRFNVAPGKQAEGPTYWLFTLLDQVDSVAGCLLLLAIVWLPPLEVVATALVLCSLVHFAFNLVFVWLGLKGRAL
jgi:hypothetical protein